MKTKGARLTTEISLPGRFVVYTPNGEGIGVSRRLDGRRARAAEGHPQGARRSRRAASSCGPPPRALAEDVEGDLAFLQKALVDDPGAREAATAPALVYQEAELPLRVVRDLFTGDFERRCVDHERTYKRVVSYLKRTSPDMAERVERYHESSRYGALRRGRSRSARRSTGASTSPPGATSIFDYAEAFTVIDVNTGRFVGSRGKSATGRLEDTITKNNLEAAKEIVRQLRLRDIGGIIVIDFIDMANPKNRQEVEEALQTRARARPDEDVRRRDLAARARRDDAPERHRRPARDPHQALPGLRRRRHRRLGGDRRSRRRASSSARCRAGSRGEASASSCIRSRGAADRPWRLPARGDRGARRAPVRFESREDVPSTMSRCSPRASSRRSSRRPPSRRAQELELSWSRSATTIPRRDRPARRLRRRVSPAPAKLVGKKVARPHRARARRHRATPARRRRTRRSAPITAESEAEKPTRAPRRRSRAGEAAAEAAEADEAKLGLEERPSRDAGGRGREAAATKPARRGRGPPKKKTRRGTRGGRGRKKPRRRATRDGDRDRAGAGRSRRRAAARRGRAEPHRRERRRPKPRRAAAPRIHVPARSAAADDADVAADSARCRGR